MAAKRDGQPGRLTFALEILKLLAEKPYKRHDLADLLAERGYASGDVLQKLTRAIRQLRDCGFEIDGAPHSPYVLKESNFPLILSPQQREALAMAAHFLADMGFSTQAGYLVRLGQLPDTQQLWPVKIDASPPVDYSDRQFPKIVEQLQERISQQCRYTIRYRNSQGGERMWDLDRSELRLHNGVLYLFAYVPEMRSRHLSKLPNAEQNMLFRLDRITQIGAASQTRWLLAESGFPTLAIRYRMSGPLASYQPRRPQETILHREADCVEIETVEDCLFWFEKRILQYGANALVLEPAWFMRQIEQTFERACARYQSNPEA